MSYDTTSTRSGTSTGQRTITAFFDSRSDADAAVERLVSAGIPRSDVNIRAGSGDAGSTSTTSARSDDMGFWESLKDLFVPDEDRATYAEGLRRGGFLVTAKVAGAHYEKALDILDDEGTVDLDERAETWRSEGWSGTAGAAAAGAGSTSGTTMSGTTTPSAGTRAMGGASAARGATSGTLTEGRDEVIPIAEEELRIGKREVDHGRVRVRSYVVDTPVQEQVSLHDEHVSVERRPVDRAATDADHLWKDQSIEATESAEQAVVSKDVRVKEELRLRKDSEDRTETVSDSVRRTEVEVEDDRGTTTRKGGATADRKIS